MIQEPPIDRPQLKAAAHSEYGIQGSLLTFIPLGYTAATYRLTCMLGATYFLKLWPRTPIGPATQRRASLYLSRALHERRLLPNVSYPLKNRKGELESEFSGFTFALFPFIDGTEPDFAVSPELWDRFAETLATLHRATPMLSDVLPHRENFDISMLGAVLKRTLALLEQTHLPGCPGFEELRTLVLPRRGEIFDQFARLSRLQHKVQCLRGPFVVCHTDAGSANLLIDRQSKLHVLDWDEARLAPPEHDLHEAREGDFGRTLRVYREHGGAQPLYLEHFAFYLLRRHLGDMTARMERVLFENATGGELEEALEGVEMWGFRQWRELDHTLGRLESGLKALSAS